MQIALVLGQLDDGISHQLAGAVVGHISPALCLNHLNLSRDKHVGQRLAVPAQGDHVRVLDEQQRVGLAARSHGIDQALLLGPGLLVGKPAEIDNPQQRRLPVVYPHLLST